MHSEQHYEHSSRGARLLLSGSSTRTSGVTASGSRFRRRPAPCASITANAVTHVFPAGLTVPAPLAALAHEAQHSLLVATATARTLLVARGSTAPLRRHNSEAPVRPHGVRASALALQAAPAVGLAVREGAAAAVATAAVAVPGPAPVRGAQHFLAGGIAGAVSKTLVAPLERVSTMLMADASKFSVKQAAVHAWTTGLYRGHAATLLKIMPASAIQFTVFHSLKDRILTAKQRRAAAAAATAAAGSPAAMRGRMQTPAAAAAGAELGNHERMVAGAAAGAAAVCVCYPLESMRTMMSVAGGVHGNLLQAAGTVVRSRGLGALYRGFQATLIGDMLGNSLGFTCYEIGNRIYRDLNGGVGAPPHLRGIIGACSASCVVTLTMPMEVVKRRLQVQGLAGRPVLYRNTFDCLRQILHKEGIGSFYAASLPIYLKVAPSIGCMYFLYEFLTSTMSKGNLAKPAPAAAVALAE